MLEAPQLDALEIVMVAAAQTIGSVTVLLVNATKTMLEEEALDEETETVEEAVVVAETLAEAGLTATIPELVDATTTLATDLPNLGAPLLHLLVSLKNPCTPKVPRLLARITSTISTLMPL